MTRLQLPENTGAALTADEREALLNFYRAVDEEDMDLVDLAVTDDWENLPAEPGQARGPKMLKTIYAQSTAAFSDMEMRIEVLIAEPHRAAVRVVAAALHRGELMGIAPPGKRFTLDLHELHAFEGGRIARTWHMEDMLGLF